MDYKQHQRLRNAIIDRLHTGEIDKAKFITQNLSLYSGIEYLKLPQHFESIYEALYHYQFHNSKAKYYKFEHMSNYDKALIYSLECKNKSISHYELKEEVTIKLLNQFVDKDTAISAYFLHMNSKLLDQKLVEIVFYDLEKVVLHSLYKAVIEFLKGRGILESQSRCSIIDGYVNERFY